MGSSVYVINEDNQAFEIRKKDIEDLSTIAKISYSAAKKLIQNDFNNENKNFKNRDELNRLVFSFISSKNKTR